MHQSDIYRNPSIKKPIYIHVKVLKVEVEEDIVISNLPRVFIKMRIPPEQPKLSGRYLYAIIQSSSLASYPRQKFCESFGIQDDQYELAEGQWAAVRLMPTNYNNAQFSNIHFVAQTPISRTKSRLFANLESHGEMPPWSDECNFASRSNRHDQ